MGKSSGDSIVVAVRVRPFNDREKIRKCQLVIDMPDATTTVIRDPKSGDEKRFAYDYSYWSHDGFIEKSNGYLEPQNSHYADQKKVFEDLGKGVLSNAWAGYNCSLFAYGQTGSGKSYSIVGFKGNKGIVPIVCEELFKQIEIAKKKNSQFEVFISMFEIYCEKVRDLLSDKPPPKGGLKVREHPKTGFYVESLSSVPVSSYAEIEAKIDEGTKSRTIAATNMNATSSRAHTIVKIIFHQKIGKSGGGTTTKKSEINLVDLAGSERQSAAGTEGDRLKEGIVINQSLSTLGRVIKALHEAQGAKNGKKPQIPYRDSVLTCLLKNALGGNSKTIMVAAISPADINFEETLSTLRFADRAKSIKTNAVVNENQNERVLRELKEENVRLQQQISGGGGGSQEEIERLRRLLAENQKEMENMEKSWQQKIAEEASKRQAGASEKAEVEKNKRLMPHLWNLNEDAALTNVIVHFIPKGDVVVGNRRSESLNQVQLNGLSILPHHATFRNNNNSKITLIPSPGADILVNGKPTTGETIVEQNDRILFGGNHLYVFNNPSKSGMRQDVTYEEAQKEMAKYATVQIGGTSENKRDLILEEELVSTIPLVHRANAMSNELKRNVTFEVMLVSPEMRGLNDGLTEIWVKVHNVREDTYFLWEKSRFLNRYYGMQEMYEAKIDGEDWNMSKERDPFYEPPESPVFLASCVVFLQSLAYLVDCDEQFPIVDFSGNEIGQLSVGLSPCSTTGKDLRGEYVENPSQIVGRNIAFKVKVGKAIGLQRRIFKSYCKYRFFGAKEVTTDPVTGNSPDFRHEHVFPFKPVTKELMEYLRNSNLYITLWGTQKSRDSRGRMSSADAASFPPKKVIILRVGLMTFFHFINCVALAFAPYFIVYKYSGINEYSSVWKCAQAGGGYLMTQLAKLLLLATFFPAAETDGFAVLPEFLKSCSDVLDVIGMHIVMSYLLAGKGEVRFISGGIGWGAAHSIAHRVLMLWVGARGSAFSWVWIQTALDSSSDLLLILSMAALTWMVTRSQNRIIVAPFLVLCVFHSFFYQCLYNYFHVSGWLLVFSRFAFSAFVAGGTIFSYALYGRGNTKKIE
ncbi:unnamed protein product [Caenorhabditis auriculariae]|uniref:Kinesin-like protein 6 n=1 Tax=Caenorhabditis auriculariae TaxID=2777116 RepID=A0A8S1GZ61_9PELO|nr:unnamed protein product [Caenorhabditis auriculariae]